MDPEIDLVADLNAEDDDGLGSSVLTDARDPSRVRPGVMLVAGNDQARAVVRILATDEDGQVHFAILPGSLAKNRHLIGRAKRNGPTASPWPERGNDDRARHPVRASDRGRTSNLEANF